ncbi:MAG TPA: hypothetical protein VGE34_00390 [Candidatus Saccharimonadales bacterium]
MVNIEHPSGSVLTDEVLEQNPVFLVSAALPGCGQSTIASMLAGKIHERTGEEPGHIDIGKELRKLLDVKNEADFIEKLAQIEDPTIFDPRIYGQVVGDDRPYVVDGKLATTAGPPHLGDRAVVTIDLESNFLRSAKRISGREGEGFLDYLRSSERHERLLGRMAAIIARAQHDMGQREKLGESSNNENVIQSLAIDTSRWSSAELTDHLAGERTDYEQFVPGWEMDALRTTQATLAYLHEVFGSDMNANDEKHFRFHADNIRYNTDRLSTMLDPEGIDNVRNELKKAITDSSFSLLLKKMPRFFDGADGGLVLDTVSHKWTPEYYKVAEAWPFLSKRLKGKAIHDPFAGAGTLMNLLAARNIPKKISMSDLSFPGGMPLGDRSKGEEFFYNIKANRDMASTLFDDLPSWYKPDFSSIDEDKIFTSDAGKLQLEDNSVDYIVADPPYGKNFKDGGIGLLLGCLDEFLRVSRDGCILMVPEDWIGHLKDYGCEMTKLTEDVSRGSSSIPVCYVEITGRRDDRGGRK